MLYSIKVWGYLDLIKVFLDFLKVILLFLILVLLLTPGTIKELLFDYLYNYFHLMEVVPNIEINTIELVTEEPIKETNLIDYDLLLKKRDEINKNLVELNKWKSGQEITNMLLEVQLEQFQIAHTFQVENLKTIQKSIDLTNKNIVYTLDLNTQKLIERSSIDTKDLLNAIHKPNLVLKSLKEILTAVHHPSVLLAELKELNFNQKALYETFNLGVVDICKVLNDKSQLNTVITEMNQQVDTLREQLNDLKNQNKESLRFLQKETKIIEEELEKLNTTKSFDNVNDILVVDHSDTQKKTLPQQVLDFLDSFRK